MVTSKLWHHFLEMVNNLCNHDGGILLNSFVYFLLEGKLYDVSIHVFFDLIKRRKTLIPPFAAYDPPVLVRAVS